MGWILPGLGDSPTDPVEVFFSRLPSPKDHYEAWLEPDDSDKDSRKPRQETIAAQLFILDAADHKSTDPDYDQLLPHIQAAASSYESACRLYEQLGAVALEKNIAVDDESNKARHLHYALWMAQGRKDETAPFSIGTAEIGNGKTDKTATKCGCGHFYATLPIDDSHRTCAQCKKKGEATYCSACMMPGPGTDTLATAYCSRACQTQHWPEHKARCKELQQLYRACAMYQEIFEHFMAETYTLQPAEMTEKKDVAMMKDESGECED